MSKHHSLLLVFTLVLAGCASEPVPPPAMEPEPAPVEVTPYVAPPDQPPPPDQPTAPAPEAPVKPEQTADGRYRIAVASVRTVEQATEWTQRIESKGYRVETETAEVDGVTWQRVVLPGYRNKNDAMAAIGFAEQDLGVSGAWRLPRVIASPTPPPAPEPAPEPIPEPAPAN